MHFNTLIIQPLLAAVALGAATSKTITANYDDITVIPAAPLLDVVTVYKGLNYTNFGVAQVLTGIALHTTPNTLVTGFEQTTLNGGLAKFEKTGKTKCFDLKSFYYSCAANTATGAAAVPIQCTFQVRGFKKTTDKIPQGQREFTFNPSSLDITTPQSEAKFYGYFKDIEKVELVMLESTTGELLNVLDIDSMTYTVHY